LRGSTRYQPAVENTFNVYAPSEFLNHAYDDEGWWALAWIDAYDWTQNPDYLNMARAIFADMIGGWDDVCGGGLWWTKARTYKNAIANELFLSVAAHLANRLTDPDEQAQALEWARIEWAWFSQSGMINQDNLINDGLTRSCQNNHQTTWTYNQGVILVGLVELYQQDQDPSEPDAAQTIASAVIDNLTDASGILHERCEPTCSRDGVQFKGIFLRNLMALNDAFPDERYVDFAATNAQSIWHQDRGLGYQFGQVWSGPFDSGDAGKQSSALDALIAAEMAFLSVRSSAHREHEADRHRRAARRLRRRSAGLDAVQGGVEVTDLRQRLTVVLAVPVLTSKPERMLRMARTRRPSRVHKPVMRMLLNLFN